jgi:K+-transporting ATPase ATPase C chain
MLAQLRSHLILLVASILLCCVFYPLVLLLFASTFASTSATGGIVVASDGKGGASLIAQEFKGDEWFHPRPSAVGYAANASGGSNLAANNPKLRDRVSEQLKGEYARATPVPVDGVTASGSGLDPHLTLAAAKLQVARVAAARNTPVSEIEALLNAKAFTPLLGLAGEPLVNVFEVNWELHRLPLAAR